MIRVAGTIIALTLAVVPALAQERPPEAEPDTAQTADRRTVRTIRTVHTVRIDSGICSSSVGQPLP